LKRQLSVSSASPFSLLQKTKIPARGLKHLISPAQ